MVNGLPLLAAGFQEVGIVIVVFGIVRQSLDTRPEMRTKWKEMRHEVTV